MAKTDFLHAKDGLIIGVDEKNNFCRVDGYQHIFLMAPTGAGKGVSFVIPNLLSTQESVIVHDIKMENYALTSGWRAKQKQNIYLYEPLNPYGKTHCYNPLDFVSKNSDQMFDDIQKMAFILLPDNHYYNHTEERNLFIALALYVIANNQKTKSFGEIYRILISDVFKELKSTQELKIHKAGLMLISNFLSTEKEAGSAIASNLAGHLELWGNPLIDHATSKSDFNPADFRSERATLYVGLNPGDIQRLKPLMQFFYQHIAQSLCTAADNKKDTHGVLFMLDEFPSLGKMDIFPSCIPYFRGYKIRLLMIAQDINDIKSSYCEKATNSILSNSTFKVAFTANNFDTANFISNLSVDRVKREVMISWQAVMSIDTEQQILITDNQPPMIIKKLRYHEFPEFEDRIIEPAKLEFSAL